uniref:Secreted phosphoprotein 24 n=1 Tax=Mola mola TaxID=94237 RepID=A0A3Q3VXL0_MOLML
ECWCGVKGAFVLFWVRSSRILPSVFLATASRGIRASLAQVNSVYNSHLYRVTRGSVSRVIPLGPNSVELLLKFGIKETVCVKTSTQDPQTCAFRPGFFVPSSSCFSRVQLSPTSQQVISLRCSRDESSSSESSEEVRIVVLSDFPLYPPLS